MPAKKAKAKQDKKKKSDDPSKLSDLEGTTKKKRPGVPKSGLKTPEPATAPAAPKEKTTSNVPKDKKRNK